MDPLPAYSSSLSPPSYEMSAYTAQLEQESVWPRNYRRETPRINVAKFYHDLMLLCPQELHYDDEHDNAHDYNNDYDSDSDDDGIDRFYYTEKRILPSTLSSSSSSSLSSSTSTSSASSSSSSSASLSMSISTSTSTSSPSAIASSVPMTSITKPRALSKVRDDYHSMKELSRLLVQTWSEADTVPSYEAFKEKVKHQDFRPIANSDFQSSSLNT